MRAFDDLFKKMNNLGDMSYNAGSTIREFFSKLDRFNRYLLHENKMWRLSRVLYVHPNNVRKMKQRPMIRKRAYEKAYRNKRRCP